MEAMPRGAEGFLRATLEKLTPAARVRIFVYLVLAFQAVKVARLVPIENLADGNALTQFHYSQMFADVTNDRKLLANGTRSWGYDPFVAAGTLVGAGLVPESHAAIRFDRLLRRWLSPAVTIKLFVWLALLLGPVLVAAAARWFGFGAASTVVVTALAGASLTGYGFLSGLLISLGDVAFWLGGPLAIFNAAALYATTRRSSRPAALAFFLTLPVLLLLDPGIFVMQAVPVSVLLVSLSRRRNSGFLLTAALLASMAVNAFWLKPYAMFHWSYEGAMMWWSAGAHGILSSLLGAADNSLWIFWGLVRAFILVAGLYQLWSKRQAHRVLAQTLTAWLIAIFLVGFFGGRLMVLHELEPGHLPYLLFLILSFPAADYMAARFLSPGTVRQIVFVWFLWLLVSWQSRNPRDCYPIRDVYTRSELSVLSDLRGLPRDRRVLVEYSPQLNDMLHMSAPTTGLVFVGFPSTWWRAAFHESAMLTREGGDLMLFGVPLSRFDDELLKKALVRYNVGTIVVTSPDARDFFDGFPDLVAPRRTVDTDPDRDHWVYDVLIPGTGYVLSGRGRAVFSLNHIRVHTEGAGQFLLSFHWVNGLRVPPPVSIRPRYFPNDPLPFIEIKNPAGQRDFVVSYETDR